MHRIRRSNDSVHWFMNELASRIVAESGIPSDRHHLGKLIFQSFKDSPEFVMQFCGLTCYCLFASNCTILNMEVLDTLTEIDGGTNMAETSGSALERSVKCATALKNLGLQRGDVIVLMAPSHIDLAIPLYAALYLGIIVAPVDRTLTVRELKDTFSVHKPKIIFCQSEKATDIQLALNDVQSVAQIVTFDNGDYMCTFDQFLDKHGDDTSVDEFRPADFNSAETMAFLIATSGTTGVPKAAAATHENFAITGPYWWSKFTDFPTPTRMVLLGSPLQWLTAIINFLFSPIMRYTRLQTSRNLTPDHAYHLINTYKPTLTVMSPTMLNSLIKLNDSNQCDFSCLEVIYLGGSAVPVELIEEVKDLFPSIEVFDVYGMSELTGLAFHADHPAPGSSGKPMGCLQYRLIDVETQEDIIEPKVQGELWLKGPGIFKEYYNNPAATEEVFTEDRWFKTGDIFYRDENWNFFFVERLKLLLKYMSHHISPVEVEGVIRQHPGVLDVAVTGIPDPAYGDLAVACVVRKPGAEVSADEIKNLVKCNLTDSKQLRGGVIFLNEIPTTASTKVHRRKLKEIALQMERE